MSTPFTSSAKQYFKESDTDLFEAGWRVFQAVEAEEHITLGYAPMEIYKYAAEQFNRKEEEIDECQSAALLWKRGEFFKSDMITIGKNSAAFIWNHVARLRQQRRSMRDAVDYALNSNYRDLRHWVLGVDSESEIATKFTVHGDVLRARQHANHQLLRERAEDQGVTCNELMQQMIEEAAEGW